jgi:hypothetical protein
MNYFGTSDASKYLAGIGLAGIANESASLTDLWRGI